MSLLEWELVIRTQLQVVAAIGAILKGTVSERLADYEQKYDFKPVSALHKKAAQFRGFLETAINHVKNHKSDTFREYHATRLVQMTADTIISYLLCIDALVSEQKKKTAQLFISKALYRIKANYDFILLSDDSLLKLYKDIID